LLNVIIKPLKSPQQYTTGWCHFYDWLWEHFGPSCDGNLQLSPAAPWRE